jgi:prevent-host-death family protein
MEGALQDAKNRFSEFVQRARVEGPQVVTLRGAPAVVVLSWGPAWPDDLVTEVNRRAKTASRRNAF